MTEHTAIERLEIGIDGFDLITNGGLPKGRTTLVSGTAGSGKTIFATQFLIEGITQADETGVFITFEESPEDIRKNFASFGWDIAAWEAQGKWIFVDVSLQAEEEWVVVGSYDLGALLARIENAVKQANATRVSLDSVSAIFSRFNDERTIRSELFRIATALKRIGVTTVITAERDQEYGDVARFGVEEFVSDNVIILRNVLERNKRRRTIEILKFRGVSHQKGEFSFTITQDQGIVVVPLSAIQLSQSSSNIRISSGNDILDEMCGGGFFRGSIILVSGATGTGKTLTVTEFLAGGVANNERGLLFAFEESREQLFRNAAGWGVDFEQMEKEGKLEVVCDYPEVMSMEDHLIRIRKKIEQFRPDRLAVDSLSALERVSGMKGFREFVLGLTSFIKHQEITGLFTSTTPSLMGGASVTEAHISTLTDAIILLRYVEMSGRMSRGIMVLKMRGSQHEKDIRSFSIDHQGMHIGNPFRHVTGIITGNPAYNDPEEIERLRQITEDGSN